MQKSVVVATGGTIGGGRVASGILVRLLKAVIRPRNAGKSRVEGIKAAGGSSEDAELAKVVRKVESRQYFQQRRREAEMGVFGFPPSYFDIRARW